MLSQAWRGPGPGRPEHLAIPPRRMPPLLGTTTRKRWRWVGGFGEELSLCAAYARVGPIAQSWWAVWDRGSGRLHQVDHFGRRGDVRLPLGRVLAGAGAIDLSFTTLPPVEVVSPHGSKHIWTAKQGGIVLRGTVLGRPVELRGIVDDSAGYHARETAWRWTCGVGTTTDGRDVAWNLVTGVHDGSEASERTVWVDGTPHEVGPVVFADDLSAISGEGLDLAFTAEAARAHQQDAKLFASSYEQPFGTFSGTLPHAGALSGGYGVMERHAVRW